MNGYSSGDGAPGSVSSRSKSDHIGNTEISLDNIVEGGRRKRAKFESSVRSACSTTSLHSTRSLANFTLSRNSHCSLLRRCQLQPRILPSPRHVAWSINEHPSPSHTPHNIPSPILSLYNLHKAIATHLGSLDYTLRLRPVVAHEGQQHSHQTDCLSAALLAATALAYSLHLTQLLAVACQKKTRMWHYN